jgi:pyruvate formate lyase activating enzyme
MTGPPRTSADTLLRAAEIGRQAGLRFVYPGNLAGLVGGHENTHCPKCSAVLIERVGFEVRRNRMNGARCPACAATVPGVWQENPRKASVGGGAPRRLRA